MCPWLLSSEVSHQGITGITFGKIKLLNTPGDKGD